MFRFRIVLVFFLVACSDLKQVDDAPQAEDVNEWITYEGRVPTSDNENLMIEVSILPLGAGEGNYVLREFWEREGGTEQVGSFKGKYSTFSTAEGNIEIHFQNSSYETGIKRSYRSPDGKRIREEEYRVRDLVLRKDGDYRMIALDNANEPITLEENFNLSRRTSIVFTVEGTFAHVGDSAVFYEINTDQSWSVSRQGAYGLATRQYHQLANSKNEGIYLKGTAFSIQHSTAKGRKNMLVFKKIITMTSSPVVE